MQRISTSEELQDILKKNKKVVCTFSASWCGPCRALHPVLEEAIQKNSAARTSAQEKVVWLDVDVDDAEKLCQEHSIQSVPTLFFFQNGNCQSHIVGPTPQKLQDFLRGMGVDGI
tara:strand:- start:117 stop:461 length:345 start_codon:yes stop_codon:yes gene_type:complete